MSCKALYDLAPVNLSNLLFQHFPSKSYYLALINCFPFLGLAKPLSYLSAFAHDLLLTLPSP